MGNLTLLDTGVWVTSFLQEDIFHAEADQLIFLQTMDFLVACYALYWDVEVFYSFDEKLNKAMRRIKPEIVKLKIRRGRVVEA